MSWEYERAQVPPLLEVEAGRVAMLLCSTNTNTIRFDWCLRFLARRGARLGRQVVPDTHEGRWHTDGCESSKQVKLPPYLSLLLP